MLALSAVAAGSASAAEARWKVNGAFLGAGATKSFTATSTGTMYIKVPGVFTTVLPECTETGKIVGSAAGQPGKKKEVTITCKGVTIEGLPKCKVSSPGQAVGTILTNKLTGTLDRLSDSNEGVLLGERLKGELGPQIWTYVITGEACPLEGNWPMTGELVSQVTPSNGEAETGTMTFPTVGYFGYWDYMLEPKCEPERISKETGLCRRKTGYFWGGKSTVLSGALNFSLSPKEKFGVFLG